MAATAGDDALVPPMRCEHNQMKMTAAGEPIKPHPKVALLRALSDQRKISLLFEPTKGYEQKPGT